MYQKLPTNTGPKSSHSVEDNRRYACRLQVQILLAVSMTVKKISVKEGLIKKLDSYGSDNDSYSNKIANVLSIAEGKMNKCPLLNGDEDT